MFLRRRNVSGIECFAAHLAASRRRLPLSQFPGILLLRIFEIIWLTCSSQSSERVHLALLRLRPRALAAVEFASAASAIAGSLAGLASAGFRAANRF